MSWQELNRRIPLQTVIRNEHVGPPFAPAEQQKYLRELSFGYDMLRELHSAAATLSPEERSNPQSYIRMVSILLLGSLSGEQLASYARDDSRTGNTEQLVDHFLLDQIKEFNTSNRGVHSPAIATAMQFAAEALLSPPQPFEAFLEHYVQEVDDKPESALMMLLGLTALASSEQPVLTYSQNTQQPSLLNMHIRRTSTSSFTVARKLHQELRTLQGQSLAEALEAVKKQIHDEDGEKLQTDVIRDIGGISWLISAEKRTLVEKFGFTKERGAQFTEYDPEALLAELHMTGATGLPFEEVGEIMRVSLENVTMSQSTMVSFLRGHLPKVGKVVMPIASFFQE